MPRAPDGRQLVQLTGDPMVDARTLNDAIIESNADLFNRDGTLVLLRDGAFVVCNRDILLEVLNRHVCVKRVVKNGDGRVEVAYGPVDLEEMTMKALLLGRLPPKGGNMPRELPGGPLADRVPKA
jgi:hypothetical protein